MWIIGLKWGMLLLCSFSVHECCVFIFLLLVVSSSSCALSSVERVFNENVCSFIIIFTHCFLLKQRTFTTFSITGFFKMWVPLRYVVSVGGQNLENAMMLKWILTNLLVVQRFRKTVEWIWPQGTRYCPAGSQVSLCDSYSVIYWGIWRHLRMRLSAPIWPHAGLGGMSLLQFP